MDKLKAMRVFVAIVQAGSLTGASNLLGVSLTSVVRSLAALETELGTRLLHRTTRKVVLSSEGREYVERCQQILQAVEDADDALQARQLVPRGALSVTAPVLFGRLHVAPLIGEFLSLFPNVDVQLLLVDRVVDLLSEGMDVALRIGPDRDSSMMFVRVGEISRIVCADPGYLEKHGIPKHPQDLTSQSCVQFVGTTPGSDWMFLDGEETIRINVRYKLRTNDGYAALQACRQGVGYCSFLGYQAHKLIQEGELVRVLKPFELSPLPVNLIYPSARLMSSRVRVFLDWMTPRLRERLAEIG